MRIGLDLDNTIINYDLAFISAANSLGVNLPEFCITKTKIKNFVRALDQGDILWQRLQGKVYSKFIETHGQLYSGVKRFLLHSKFPSLFRTLQYLLQKRLLYNLSLHLSKLKYSLNILIILIYIFVLKYIKIENKDKVEQKTL